MKLRLYQRYTLILVVLLLSAVAIISSAAVATFANLSERAEQASVQAMARALHEEEIEEARQLAALTSQILANSLYTADLQAINDDIRAIRQYGGIVAARVFDAQGRLLHDGSGTISDFGRRSRDSVVREAVVNRRTASVVDADILSLATPVMIGERLLGAVHIEVSIESISLSTKRLSDEMTHIADDSERSLLLIMLSAALVLCVIALLAGVLVARSLAQPIKALSALTHRIGQGDYDVAPPIERSDEIGDLARDLSKMARDLKQASRMSQLAMVGEVAVGVAHELNQPLNTIRMAADNALAGLDIGDDGPDYARAKLELVSQLAGRMGEQIQRMCAVGRRDERHIAFDPVACVADALALHGGAIEAAGIEVNFTPPNEPQRTVLGLPIQFTQVVLNLLTNARDAIIERSNTPLGRLRSVRGRIWITAETDEARGELRIIVADNGSGMPQEIMSRIFDPFFTTKEVGKGTGLGLSISYGIVSAMGGRIDARNGIEGAVFTIILPLMREAEATAPGQRAAE